MDPTLKFIIAAACIIFLAFITFSTVSNDTPPETTEPPPHVHPH